MPSISFSDVLSAIFIAIIVLPMLRNMFRRRVTPLTIPVVNMSGIIMNAGKGGATLAAVEQALDKVERMRPKSVIVRINSPGGTVGASQAIHARLRRLSAHGTRVVALMEDVAASGGLYVAMGADWVIAHPGTMTGSIGVIMQFYEISEILQDLRVNVSTIRSGEFKDVGSTSRPMRAEDRAILQGMVDDTYAQFRDAVAHARTLSTDAVASFADGRIMSGRQALGVGLVDELGSFPEAVRAAELYGNLRPGTGRLAPIATEKKTFADMLRGSSPSPFAAVADLLAETKLSGIPLWLARTR